MTLDHVKDAFKKYLDAAKHANQSEQAFHNVEFREFDERQKCVDEARKRLEDTNVDRREFANGYRDCLRKVTNKIKKEIVNKADLKRRVDRKGLSK